MNKEEKGAGRRARSLRLFGRGPLFRKKRDALSRQAGLGNQDASSTGSGISMSVFSPPAMTVGSLPSHFWTD